MDILDHEGLPVIPGETAETQIKVWKITPSIDRSYDSAFVRSYPNAVNYGKRVVETIMEGHFGEDYPVSMTINIVNMTLYDYGHLMLQ